MKRTRGIVVVIFLIAMVVIGGWRWSLSSPSWGEWESMKMTTKIEFWPAISQYYVFRNGMSVSMNGQAVGESNWIDCTFWNGSGIDSITIFAIDGIDTITVDQGVEAATGFSAGPIENSEFIGFSAWVNGPSFDRGDKRCDVSLHPGIVELYIILYDSHGNISESLVSIPPEQDDDNSA